MSTPLDNGSALPPEACVAVECLRHDWFLSRDERPDVWAALIEHREAVAQRLSEAFQTLTVRERDGYAWSEAVRVNGRPVPFASKRPRVVTIAEAAMLMALAEERHLSRVAGDSETYVEKKKLAETMAVLLKNTKDASVSPADVARSCRSTIEKALSHHLGHGYIARVPGSDDRVRVLPGLDIAMAPGAVEEMLAMAGVPDIPDFGLTGDEDAAAPDKGPGDASPEDGLAPTTADVPIPFPEDEEGEES